MHVLLPVDDMPYTLAALHSIRSRLWPAGTHFTLARVIEDCSTYATPATAEEYQHSRNLQSDTEYHEEKARKWLGELAAALQLPDCQVDTALLKGKVATELASLANQQNIDYIVIGSHDRSPRERAWLGSVASAITERVNCSVEIIRPRRLNEMLHSESLDLDEVENIDYAPRKIVVAADFSKNSLKALEWVRQIDWRDDARIALVSVAPPVAHGKIELKLQGIDSSGLPSRRDDDLMIELKNQALSFGANYRDTIFDTRVLKGQPADAILNYAQQEQADLIVIGSHGEDRQEEESIGSVAQAVINGSHCSVVAIDPTTADVISFQWAR